MTHPKRKLIGGILLLLILTGLFGGFLQISNGERMISHQLENKASVIKAVSQSLEIDFHLSLDISTVILEKIEDRVQLGAAAFRKVMEDDWDGKPMFFLDGAVITVAENVIRYPKGFPADGKIDIDQLTGELGTTYTYFSDEDSSSDQACAVYFCRIDESAWFIVWENDEIVNQKLDELFNFSENVAGIEKAYNVDLLVISAPENEDEDHLLIYRSENLPESLTAEELGITGEMISKAFGSSDELSVDRLSNAFQTLEISGQVYELYFRRIDGPPGTETLMACLIPFQDTKARVQEQIGIILALFAAIEIVFLVWLFSVLMFVRRHSLNERQRAVYSTASCRRRILGFLGVAAVIVLVASVLLFSLFRMFSIYRQVDTSILALAEQIEDNEKMSLITEKANREIYEDCVAMTAELLTEYPDLFSSEDLQRFCDINGADYIMLFDPDGNEILTNSGYVGLSLGNDALSSTYEFRLLLNGVPMITHDLMTDEQTKLTNFMLGARVGRPEEGERYGALLMAVPKERIIRNVTEVMEDIMPSFVPEGMLIFSVDEENGTILNASDPTLPGKTAAALGLPEEALRNGFQDFFTLDGLSYFGKSMEINGVLYICAVQNRNIYSRIPTVSSLTALVSLVFLLLLALYMMAGYREDFEKYAFKEIPDENAGFERLTGSGRKKRKEKATDGEADSGISLPRRNAAIAARILLVVGVAWISVKVLSGWTGISNSPITFIVRGQWAKGFNLFAFTGIFILLAEVVVTVTVLKLFVRILGHALDQRGETVCRLLLNLLNYGSIIVFVYFALYDLDFSPGTLLASLGILSFAISLGAQDLVTDILAGLSIIFDKAYQAGDIIEVDGYRGEVLEIGVRTTKLEGTGGNIKIIGNRDVKNIVNLTRNNSWYSLEIKISDDQPLDKTEALLNEHLPQIRESIPEIISGPHYKGVISFGNGCITLSVIAECKQENYRKVQRSLNRAVLSLFAENGIKIL